MISAFKCDFALAKDDHLKLSELDELIKNNNPVILRDIELLEELEFMLRHGQVEIHIKQKK